EGNDVVAFLHARDPRPDIDDNACAFMAQDGREQPFRIGAGKRELVGVADTSGLHLDQHLSGLGPVEVDLRDLERLGLLQCNSSPGFHGGFPPRRKTSSISRDRCSEGPVWNLASNGFSKTCSLPSGMATASSPTLGGQP